MCNLILHLKVLFRNLTEIILVSFNNEVLSGIHSITRIVMQALKYTSRVREDFTLSLNSVDIVA